MSVSRRASFAAGIAAVRRDRKREQQDQEQPHQQQPHIEAVPPQEPSAESTITVVAGLTSPAGVEKGLTAMDLKAANTFAAVAKAATVATKKPRIQYEVRPFTPESLEKINIRTNNLIRDYGFLPKRSPNLVDGAQLPAKYEPFPVDLLGKPVEELDQYVYEKVSSILSRVFHADSSNMNEKASYIYKVKQEKSFRFSPPTQKPF